VGKNSSPDERRRAEGKARLAERVMAFCIDNWDNELGLELQDELDVQRAMLQGG